MKKSPSINIFSKLRLFSKGRGKPSPFKKRLGKEYIAVIGAFLVGIIILVWSAVNFLNVPEVQSQEATLILAFENGGKGRMFTGEVREGMTILDALIVSSEAGQIKLKYDVGVDGKVTITGLNGYDSSFIDKKMVFYLNQKRIETERIDSIIIKPGDNIEVRLE